MADNIYGEYKSTLELVRTYLLEQLKLYGNAVKEETGASAYEHVISRIKSPESMREKCVRKGLPLSIETMLQEIHDAVGIRIVCRFVDSWASLEHEMKYKKDIANPEMISRELKRCADELASCDLSMQTIRNLIHGK